MYDYIMLDNEYNLMDKEEVEALNQDYSIIRQDLDKLEKTLKAIEILKKTLVLFKYGDYFMACITEQEYELLKEVLENE